MVPYIIAVDFDGTLVKNSWPDISKAELNQNVMQMIHKQLKNNPHTVFILWTSRTGQHFLDAVDFCQKYKLPIEYFNEDHPAAEDFRKEYGGDMPPGKSIKIWANEYWDDSAVTIK